MISSFSSISRVGRFLLLVTLLAGCSGGGSGSAPDDVTISGVVSYDRVPFNLALLNGLDFTNIQSSPSRGVSVHLLDADDFILAATKTDDNGAYRFDNVPGKTLVRVRVLAEVTRTSSLPLWDIKLLDHTSGHAQYVLDGALVSSGKANSVRDLHAASGWNAATSQYSSDGARAAAPFAILDTFYSGLQRLVEVDPLFRLDELEVFWSPRNNTASVSFYDGDIRTTFYRNNRIYVLGQEDVDTDEFDQHKLLHEWAHFIEDNLSRTDTIGGGHNIIESLDSRLAFSEGLANAFSAIIVDDPVYRDSFGVAQSEDFPIDMEDNPNPGVGDSAGWYVESSIHALLYDFYDADNENHDMITTGFQPIYDVLTSDDYKDESALLTIYPFIDRFRSHPLVDSAAVGQFLLTQNINGTGSYGAGELNDGGDMDVLPIYVPLVVNGGAQQVCTTNILASREGNKLGNRRFVRFNAVPGFHTITVNYASGFSPSNPAFVLFSRGGNEVIRVPDPVNTAAYESDEDSVDDLVNLTAAGEYILEVFSRLNIDGTFSTGGDVCYSVTIVQ